MEVARVPYPDGWHPSTFSWFENKWLPVVAERLIIILAGHTAASTERVQLLVISRLTV